MLDKILSSILSVMPFLEPILPWIYWFSALPR